MSASYTIPETDPALGEIAIPVKRPRGRPISVDYRAKGSAYFAEKFREHNIVIVCECGCLIKRHSMANHIKTLKHMYITSLAKMTPQPDI